MASFRLLVVSLFVCLAVSVAFASKPDKAQIESDVRAAIAQAGFRQQPVSLGAELKCIGGKADIHGEYKLIWNSPQDWLESIDVGSYSELAIGKGEHKLHKASTASGDFWSILVHNGFNPQSMWRDGSEWKLESAKVEKVDGIPAECASFKGANRDRRVEACVDTTTKDLLRIGYVGTARYSNFESVNGHRYPRHVEIDFNQTGTVGVIAEIKSIVAEAKVPEASGAMEVQTNCTAAEVTGGILQTKVAPQYPPFARSNRIQGTVSLIVQIRTDGSVEVKNIAGGANPQLDDAAIEAVSHWKYSPTVCHGTAIDVMSIITINFSQYH